MLSLADNIDNVVAKATNFSNFDSIINFLNDIVKNNDLVEKIKQENNQYSLNIVDMCSGSGVFGIALAKVLGGKGIIHFVDIVGEYHQTAINYTELILGSTYQPCTYTCSADDTSIPDKSVDIIIEVNGFHHVPSLTKAVNESQRILKPNGIFLGLDRIHENNVSDKQLNALLDSEYSSTWLKENNYIDQKLTRRENGEGEIRLIEWEDALIDANFKNPLLIEYVNRCKRSYKVWLISNLPEKFSRLFLNFWVKPPRWSFRLLTTMILGISIGKRSNRSKIITAKFPMNVQSTIVRMEVIISSSR
tara:strand:+ start:3838 stop:4752 length:915 start_codon:yes stop_codon:yes gene_type:complete